MQKKYIPGLHPDLHPLRSAVLATTTWSLVMNAFVSRRALWRVSFAR